MPFFVFRRNRYHRNRLKISLRGVMKIENTIDTPNPTNKIIHISKTTFIIEDVSPIILIVKLYPATHRMIKQRA
jgi:hypothetical protein